MACRLYTVTAKLLSGKDLAAALRREIAVDVTTFVDRYRCMPTLAAVLVGDDAASEVYVRHKRRDCEAVGMASQLHRLPAETTHASLMELVKNLNQDGGVHGILIQLPLPAPLDPVPFLDAIDPRKDVDAFHPENVGRLVQGRPRFLPCTPHGVQQLLVRNNVAIEGKHVVVVGRSDIVGKPLSNMLLQRDSPLGRNAVNATVTTCHSRTSDLPALTRTADILVAAVGVPRFVTAEMVKPGAVVIDVGINRLDNQLVGDVDFDAVRECAGAISPVPGGVGPLTRAMLLKNTLDAAALQLR